MGTSAKSETQMLQNAAIFRVYTICFDKNTLQSLNLKITNFGNLICAMDHPKFNRTSIKMEECISIQRVKILNDKIRF